MGTNDQIMQRRRESFTSAFSSNLNTANLRISPGHGGRGFKGRVKFSFPLVDLDLVYLYIILNVNNTNRGLNLKNTFCTLCLCGWGFHVKPAFFPKHFLMVTFSLMSCL